MNGLRKLTGLSVLLFMGFSSFAQSLNFSAGYSSAIIKTDADRTQTYTEPFGEGALTSIYNLNYINGLNAAIAYEFRLGNRFSLETGLKYQKRGYQQIINSSIAGDPNSWTQNTDITYHFNYIDLPVVLNTAITTGDVRIYAKTGLYAGFMIGGKYTGNTTFTASNGETNLQGYDSRFEQEEYDNDERLTAGFLLGIGAEYKGFFFESNFTQGALTPVQMDSDLYTQEFSFVLGYKIKFNR
jgi:hypothetical protein